MENSSTFEITKERHTALLHAHGLAEYAFVNLPRNFKAIDGICVLNDSDSTGVVFEIYNTKEIAEAYDASVVYKIKNRDVLHCYFCKTSEQAQVLFAELMRKYAVTDIEV